MNTLLEQDRIFVEQGAAELLYAYIDSKSVQIFQQMDFVEKSIYRHLQAAGNEGETP